MKSIAIGSIALAALGCLSASSFAQILRNTAGGTETTPGVIATNSTLFGDAEVREEAFKYPNVANQTRGNQSELATRRGLEADPDGDGIYSGGNNSVMLLRFNLNGITAADVTAAPAVTLRLTVNTTSFTAARAYDSVNNVNYGLQYHGLVPTATGQNWDESTVSFQNAPGLTYDAGTNTTPTGLGTPGYNSDTTPLGTADFPTIATGNVLVGTAIDFSSPALTQLVLDAINAGNSSVTILAGLKDPYVSGYNYIFASNDTTALLTQAASPLSGASNADGRFSPTLAIGIIPEPASLGALALGGLLLSRRRKA
jgi:hypothetical protein